MESVGKTMSQMNRSQQFNYEELVAKQSEYITEIAREDDSRKYLPLLKISDKILAGFIYSKIVRAPEYVRTDIRVWNKEIVSGISEHHLIEIVGNPDRQCIRSLYRRKKSGTDRN